MVSSFESSSLVAPIILLFLLVTPSSCAKNLIAEICPQTRNPSFCVGLLNSTPGAATADLMGLAKITISLAHNSASRTYDQIRSLVKQASNPQLKQHYKSCTEYYSESLSDLDQAREYLASGDYDGVNIQASSVMTYTDDCDEEINKPPTEPSGVSKKNQELTNICGIILVIANELRDS
ncbi:PMEI domain-containing protein [Cephalotus follicularis]|uniref:PMEI domain-containing protein n=1 Tax=Cephalotus follicularis TaxID=3775 RepID=A0A1Q3BUK9_CEPFO|nr:PMEI domain-containing protein [Cephalotus follicularis]